MSPKLAIYDFLLDPAMGSGHFLVEAVDYITDRMADFLTAFPWNPVVYELAKTRNEITEEMERQGVTVNAGRLTDLNLLKRHVLKGCIYGVDLNPMAVELAKVSLWLDCFTLGAPLSFLDHHMKLGNSLIGTRVEEARSAIEQGQLSLFFGSSLWASALLATDAMIQVGKLSDVTAEQVHVSKEQYKKATDALAPYKRILDVYTSRWFGNEVIKGRGGRSSIDKSIDFLRSPLTHTWLWHPDRIDELDPEQQAVAQTASKGANTYRFFHWELEFPEVFFGPSSSAVQAIQLRDNAGFDAVVGNPPYVDLKGMNPILVDYYFATFPVAENRINVFAFFESQGISLVKHGLGAVGFILPAAILVQESYRRLRKRILEDTAVIEIVRLPSEMFGETAGEVKVDTMILCLRRRVEPGRVTSVLIYSGFSRVYDISPSTASAHAHIAQSTWLANEGVVISLAMGSEEENIVRKLRLVGVDLESLCYFSLGLTPYDKYAGHTEEQIKNQVFHSVSRAGPSYRRLLESGDVSRYLVEWNGKQWIDYGEWLAAPREQRFFLEKHILINQIVDWTTRRIRAGIADEELYNTQNAFNLLPRSALSLEYLVSLINSTLMNFVHATVCLDES
jgi:Eco57I restriction-modification methylase/TaqI-like C-terminal specificity domain